jgi:hypothetical protein
MLKTGEVGSGVRIRVAFELQPAEFLTLWQSFCAVGQDGGRVGVGDNSVVLIFVEAVTIRWGRISSAWQCSTSGQWTLSGDFPAWYASICLSLILLKQGYFQRYNLSVHVQILQNIQFSF